MTTSPRLFFFDHLRTFIILMVVLHHSALAYAVHGVSWWYVRNSENSLAFDVFVLINDVFMMPMMFFIAGYFAWPSLKRKGTFEFLKDKFLRLILPFIVGVSCLGSLINYTRHLAKVDLKENYVQYWFSTYFTQDFEHFHFWFLLSLFILFVVFSIINPLINNDPESLKESKGNKLVTQKSLPIRFLLAFATLTGTCFFIVNLFVEDYQWINIFNVLIFQPTRSILYISYFFLGILGFRKRWFVSDVKDRFYTIWLLNMIILVITIVCFKAIFPIPNSLLLKFLYAMLHSFLCLSIFVVVVEIFRRKLNKPSNMKQRLSLNSYSIYLIHMVLVVFFQFVFLDFLLSPYLKFILVSILGLLMSYVISEYVLRRIPGVKKIL